MNKGTILSIVALVALFVAVDARKKAGCMKPEVIELDEEWVEEKGESYWWAALGSKLRKAKHDDDDEPADNSTSGAKKRCWSALVKSPVGAVPFPMHCKYDEPKTQNCGLKTEGTPVHKFVRYFGEFSATLSDDSTYIVAFGCLLGKDDYWVAMSIKKKFDEETKDLILDHVETMGFSKRDLKSDKDLVSIEKVKMVQCKKSSHKRKKDDGLPGEASDKKR